MAKFTFRTTKGSSKRAAENRGCYKQQQHLTMASDKTDDPTYPNHEWVPPSLTAARRKFASTRRLPHKKMQRCIFIAAPIRREYMEDAPADKVASVNAFDGRGGEGDGTNRTDEHSSLRATSHQPTSNGGDKKNKGADGTAARRDAIQTGAGMQNQSRILCGVANSPTAFRRTKGCKYTTWWSQRGLQANKGWQSAGSA